MYENKIALVIKNDLQPWQKLNVAAFLASAVAIKFPDTHGKEFVNASGSTYLPFIKHPILIYGANSGTEMERAFNRAKGEAFTSASTPNPCLLPKTKNRTMLK